MPGGRRLHNVFLAGMPARYRWLRALATTDVDSGPGAPLGAAHRRCSRDQARQTLPGTSLYWVISIRRKQGGLPTRHDTSSLGRTQSCISTVCIQANNILVVMGNILLMRRPPPRSLSGIASIGYVPLPVLRPHRISSRLDPPRLGTLSSVPKRPQIPHQDPCQVGLLGPMRCLGLVQGGPITRGRAGMLVLPLELQRLLSESVRLDRRGVKDRTSGHASHTGPQGVAAMLCSWWYILMRCASVEFRMN